MISENVLATEAGNDGSFGSGIPSGTISSACSSQRNGESAMMARGSGMPSSRATKSNEPPVDSVADVTVTLRAASNSVRRRRSATSMGLAQRVARPFVSSSMKYTAPVAASVVAASICSASVSARRCTRRNSERASASIAPSLAAA